MNEKLDEEGNKWIKNVSNTERGKKVRKNKKILEIFHPQSFFSPHKSNKQYKRGLDFSFKLNIYYKHRRPFFKEDSLIGKFIILLF